MNLLLDTTYLLPAIGVSIRGFPKDALVRLMEKGHQIAISDISVFELSAVGAKQVLVGTLPAERVVKGVRAIVYDERVNVIPLYESSVLLMAFKLRKLLDDFIDCLILSSALNRCDAILTEDEDIQNLKRNKEFAGFAATVNQKFKIQTLTDML
ncbi:MAG: PIN domain-containing protein [Candidatus Bathyarchaeia archaeon]